MKKFLSKVKKGVTDMFTKPIEFAREIMEDDKKRLITGFVFLGVGGALVASVYVKVPQ